MRSESAVGNAVNLRVAEKLGRHARSYASPAKRVRNQRQGAVLFALLKSEAAPAAAARLAALSGDVHGRRRG